MVFLNWTFRDYVFFANEVGEIAENEGHHPDISIGWGYCLVMIHTHAINGLSINDFILASKIDNIQYKWIIEINLINTLSPYLS